MFIDRVINLATKDSAEYLQKKQFFNQLLTVYGRKPTLEILQDRSLDIYRLHLADSNKGGGIIGEITTIAKQRNIDIVYHSRQQLSRLSKNSKQDQGVCIDIRCPGHKDYQEFLTTIDAHSTPTVRLIALDRITNPQNMGMIIRSVCAGKIDGLLIPDKGCAKLDPLVIKASAGTLFKAPLLRCQNLAQALHDCQQKGAMVYGLSSHAPISISEKLDEKFIIYVLGNETDGVSQEVNQCCNKMISIPMNNNVESLNVAITASLLAFKDVLT